MLVYETETIKEEYLSRRLIRQLLIQSWKDFLINHCGARRVIVSIPFDIFLSFCIKTAKLKRPNEF